MKNILVYKKSSFPKPYDNDKNDLFNYATKSDSKKPTGFYQIFLKRPN